MSTKTTFKRIALVAVAAMGFGTMTSVTPASAADSGFSVGYTSLTVVGAAGTGFYGYIPVNITDSDGLPAALQATESITATVINPPRAIDTTTAAADITVTTFKRNGNNVFAATTGATLTSGAGFGSVTSGSPSSAASITDSATALTGTYWFI